MHSKLSRRQLRGLGILFQGGQIQRLPDNSFRVKSQSDKAKIYRVTCEGIRWECTCDDFQEHREYCKHIFAITFLSQLPAIRSKNSQADDEEATVSGGKK